MKGRIMEKNSLANLVSKEMQLIQTLYENNGELTESLEQEFSLIENQTKQKIENYYYFLDRIKYEIERFTEQKKRFDAAVKSLKSTQTWLKNNLKFAMQTTNKPLLEGETTQFKLYESKPKLVIENEELIPSRYFIERTVYELDKEMVAKDLADGKTIDGAKLEPVFGVRSSVRKDI